MREALTTTRDESVDGRWGAGIRAVARATLIVAIAAATRAQDISQSSHGSSDVAWQVRHGVLDPPVVAQRDVTLRHPVSIHPLVPEDQPLEVSSIAWASARLILASDRHGHLLFRSELDLAGAAPAIGLPEPMQAIFNERHLLTDIEALAIRPRAGGGSDAYAICSLSNEPSGQRRDTRQHFARISLDRDAQVNAPSVVVLSAQVVRDSLHEHFTALHVEPYTSFNTDMGENTLRWGSIEGAAWTPGAHALLCGLRMPLAGDDAMLFALEGVDEAFDQGDPQLMRVTDLFRLPLDGRGVSDLAWDPITRGYLISAALSNGPKLTDDGTYPLSDLRSALFWWNGNKADRPRLIAEIHDLNVDGVCRVGRSEFIVVASDEGDVSEERAGRQSVLTLLHFTGIP